MELNLNFIFSCVSLACTVLIFCVIKFNDFAHLDKAVTLLIAKVDDQTKQLAVLTADIAYLKGHIDGSHQTKKNLRKTK